MAENEEPRSVIAAYFRFIDANDLDGLLGLFADDAVYERPGYGSIRGKEQLRRFFSEQRVIASGTHDVEQVIVDGDWVAAWGSISGILDSGEVVDERWCDVYRFSGLLICYRRTHFFRPAV